jgi:hypothetical protein
MKKAFIVMGMTAFFLSACKKEKLRNETVAKPDIATEETGLASANCTGIITVPQFPKAYLANFNTQGSCSNPPIPTYNGEVSFMNPNNGGSQATVRINCHLTGMAQNPFSCRLYIAEGLSAQGFSKLSYIDGSGCITFVADIKDVNGANLYVEEMEFNNNTGDLFVLKKGDNQYMYVISSADVLDNSPTVTAVRMASPMFPNNFTKRLSITRNGVFNYVTMEQSSLPPLVTSVYTLNSNGTLTGVATYNVPNANTNNISTYFFSGSLYLLRNNANTGSGTLYQLNVAYPTVVPTVGTVVVNNLHDLTFGGNCNL